LGITQGVFSENCVVYRGSEQTETRAIFQHQAIESGGVQSFELTAQFVTAEFSIQQDDEIEREDGSYYRVMQISDDDTLRTAILRIKTKD